MLAEVATLTATDVAGDIHLGTRFCEWEVARTETNLGICTKHLTGKGKEHLLEVGETYVLIYIETFYLMEETVSAGADSLVTVNAAWAEHTDRWLMSFHIVSLVARSMAAEKHILGNVVAVGLLYKEGVLHVAGWVVGSKVEHRKYVLVVIYLRTLEKGKAHASENVDNLILHYGEWMAGTECYRVGGTGQVDIIA